MASTIVDVDGGSEGASSNNIIAAPELQEKIVQMHHHPQHHHVNRADGDKRSGSSSDGGTVNGGGGGSSSIGVVKRRNRYTNATLIRSHSFDNGKYDSVYENMLTKSKTLSSNSMMRPSSSSSRGIQKKRNKTLSANGNHHPQHCSVDRLDETARIDCKRRRLLHSSNIDQSPLWTTLTHARTMSDFIYDS